jgi:hypothetical protein
MQTAPGKAGPERLYGSLVGVSIAAPMTAGLPSRGVYRGADDRWATASAERPRHVGFAPNSGHKVATQLTDA